MLKRVKSLGPATFLPPIELPLPEEEAAPDDVEEGVPSTRPHGPTPGKTREARRLPPASITAPPQPIPQLKSTSDLFKLCWQELGLQPPQVAAMAGYGKTQDLEGQDLQQVYLQVHSMASQPAPGAGG